VRNYAGFGSGIVEINGVMQIEIANDTYLRNGENTVENVV
jgi:hypothetical protein